MANMIGVSNVSQEIVKGWIGDANGVAQEIIAGWIGDANGVAQELCFKNGLGLFIAGGGEYGTVKMSGDGITWASYDMTVDGATSQNHIMGSLAYGNGIFVATINSKLCYSYDGVNYYTATITTSVTNSYYQVVFGKGKFVVRGTGATYYSTNGITWTETYVSTASLYKPKTDGGRLRFVNDKFIYIESGKCEYSENGVTWVTKNAPTTAVIYDITYAFGKYVAVSYGGQFWYSTDLLTWTQVTKTSGVSISARALEVGNNILVALGYGESSAYTDGVYLDSSFKQAHVTGLTGASSYDNAFANVAYHEKFVTVGRRYFAYSIDGKTWTQVVLMESMYALIYA